MNYVLIVLVSLLPVLLMILFSFLDADFKKLTSISTYPITFLFTFALNNLLYMRHYSKMSVLLFTAMMFVGYCVFTSFTDEKTGTIYSLPSYVMILIGLICFCLAPIDKSSNILIEIGFVAFTILCHALKMFSRGDVYMMIATSLFLLGFTQTVTPVGMLIVYTLLMQTIFLVTHFNDIISSLKRKKSIRSAFALSISLATYAFMFLA